MFTNIRGEKKKTWVRPLQCWDLLLQMRSLIGFTRNEGPIAPDLQPGFVHFQRLQDVKENLETWRNKKRKEETELKKLQATWRYISLKVVPMKLWDWGKQVSNALTEPEETEGEAESTEKKSVKNLNLILLF
jgi:hypothetical protein